MRQEDSANSLQGIRNTDHHGNTPGWGTGVIVNAQAGDILTRSENLVGGVHEKFLADHG
jgi:hypothetical protein